MERGWNDHLLNRVASFIPPTPLIYEEHKLKKAYFRYMYINLYYRVEASAPS